MSDQTITIESTDIVDAMSSSRQNKDNILISDAEGLRVYDAEDLCVPAQALEFEVVTVKSTGRSAYVYCVRAARRLLRLITVKARAFAVVLESRVRAFINNVFPKTGADILRQSAILNM